MRIRLFRKTIAFVLGAFLTVFYIVDLIRSQYPSQSSRSRYLASVSSVVTTISELSNMERVVLPNQTTVILEPSPSVTCQNSGRGLFLLFIVVSSPENVAKRDVIRSTFNEMESKWKEEFARLKTKSNHSDTPEVDRVFQLLFFVGQSSEHGMTDEVREEWERHGDVIVDDLQEVYLKLTVKTLRMLKWVLHNCEKAKYVVKLDDDVFVNMPMLFSFLLDQPNGYNPMLVAGHVYKEIAPDRDANSKWFTPRSVWQGERFPNFTAGFCYVLGMKAAAGIFEESKNVPLFHLEDVYLTGVVASEKLNYELTDPGHICVIQLWYHATYPSDWPEKMMIIHSVSPKQFHCWTKKTGRLIEGESGGWLTDLFHLPLILSCWW